MKILENIIEDLSVAMIHLLVFFLRFLYNLALVLPELIVRECFLDREGIQNIKYDCLLI